MISQQNQENIPEIEKMRHSAAHVLAQAVLKLYPDAKLGIGPAIENGFYYDFDFAEPVSDEILPKIEKEMRKIVKADLPFHREEKNINEAKVILQNLDQAYKLEILEGIEEKSVSFYVTGNYQFIDLCRGPHVESTGQVGAFKLTTMAGAYWVGDERNKMLTRIYGLCFETKEDLQAYEEKLEQAKERDHRKLGKELGLFVFSDIVGKGLPMWTAKGATIRRELERFIVDEEIKRGYQHVYTPDIASLKLYEKSGHYPYYKDSMYAPIQIDDEQYMLRPMTCPHHFELYLSEPRSYRELPMRIAELAKLYRYEQTGELTGLMRVRSFCLSDAHIICADSKQAQGEISRALDLIEYVANTLGLKMGKDYFYRLSLGDRDNEEKYFKDDNAWDEAEAVLRDVLATREGEYFEAPGEAAFYGPKIDIQMRNILGKEDTAFTVQYDFVMPTRFDLTYTDSEGNDQMAVVVHRSSIGAIERIMAFLIEHYGGDFPLWLSPEQVRVIPISDKHHEYAREVYNKIRQLNMRVSIDDDAETLQFKVRNAELEKVPYLAIVGDKEVETGTLSVRSRRQKNLGLFKVDEFLEILENEVKFKGHIATVESDDETDEG